MAKNITTRLVKIKKVLYVGDDKYTIFLAVTMEPMVRKKGYYKETKERLSYSGTFPYVAKGDIFEVSSYTVHPEFHGDREVVTSYKRIVPAIESDIKAFLVTRKEHITALQADKLYQQFGVDVIDKIIESENPLRNAGISKKKAEKYRNELIESKIYEDILVFLQLYDIDTAYAQSLYDRYGDNALNVLKTIPYTPCLDHVYSFFDADKIHGKLGFPANDSIRFNVALYTAIKYRAYSSGDVYIEKNSLYMLLRSFMDKMREFHSESSSIYITEKRLDMALEFLSNRKFIVIDETINKENPYVYIRELYEDEVGAVSHIKAIIDGEKSANIDSDELSSFIESYADSPLSEAQREAAKKAVLSPAFILTGGPGTGKTQTINAIISAIEALSEAKIMLAAPTGKAANRMIELTGHNAKTIHRTLGVKQYGPSQAIYLDCDYIIIDEFSMVDISLFRMLLDSIPDSARVIFVGDANQLPPVGPGLPFKELIEFDMINKACLTEVFRQENGSHIISNANEMLKSEGKILSGGDFVFKKATSEKVKDTIWAEIKFLINEGYKFEDIQVLSPLKATDVGVFALNRFLQENMNQDPHSYFYKDKEFRLGDKVIHIQNDYDLGVFNGETGYVSRILYEKTKALEVKYPDKTVVYSPGKLEELDLAYCISVHKSQGNEFKVAILPVTGSLSRGLSKKLLYTAVTRAKERFIIVGDVNAFVEGIRKDDKYSRRSGLTKRLEMKTY